MNDADLQIACLTQNPFRITPSERVTIWAGHKDLRRQLEDIIDSVRSDRVGLSEFAILYGTLGAGKSHSLRFLATSISDKYDEYRSPCVYLPTLRVSSRVTFLDLYKEVIRLLGQDLLGNLGKEVVGAVQNQIKMYKDVTPDKEYKEAQTRGEDINETFRRKAIKEVLDKSEYLYPVLSQLSEGEDDSWFYLSGSDTKMDQAVLSRLGVTGKIDSDFDAVRVLSSLVNLFCAKLNSKSEPLAKAFYLFIDELDTMEQLEPKAVVALNQAFRELVNGCPEHLCLLFGVTGDASYIQQLCADYLLARLSREPILVEALDDKSSKEFLREVLEKHRPPGAKVKPFHPFSEKAIETIVANTTNKTPRDLFRTCRRVIELASGEGLISKKKLIDEDDVEKLI